MSEREPITAELRRVMNHTTMAGVSLVEIGEYEFAHRCDAIDAVHAQLERENAELRQRVAVLDNERGNMHDGWVRLPLDADGEYIHAGDVLDGYGKTIEVVEMRHGRSGWVLISRDGNGYADTFAFSHHHAPTVEDVLTEFAAKLIERGELTNGAAQTIADYAAKLRLAGDAS